jgi:rsbT co-antagonist protein RsbR
MLSQSSPFDPLEELFASCPEMLFVADREGVLARRSALFSRALGSALQAPAKLSDRVHPDDRRAFDAAWAQVCAGAEAVRLDCRLQGSDGAYRPWECRAQLSPRSGEVHGSLREPAAAHPGVTTTLDRREKILGLIEENLPICVWVLDRTGECVLHEGLAVEQVGMKQGQLIGTNIFEAFAGQPFLEPFHQAFKGRAAHVFVESEGIPWELWCIPCRVAEGQVVEVVGISLDVSEAKRAERDLREKITLIAQQQQVINTLSTPIIEVWDKVLTLPMLGHFDSARAAAMMADLLAEVSRKGARFAILDLTGVEAVDASTAAHLLKLIQALRLLGAQGIITGIQPVVAQTMVALGLELTRITTLANLRDALRYCMLRSRDDMA